MSGPLDPAFLEFLLARLTEEVVAANHRRETVSPDRAPSAEQGLQLLDSLITDLRGGRTPDRTSLNLLLYAYGRHPDFHADWLRIS